MPTISIIIPAYKEGERLAKLARKFIGIKGCEVVAAMAEGDKATIKPDSGETIIVNAQKGRAKQMNAGAAVARGDILVFLHADTLITPHSFARVRSALAEPGAVGGAYRFKIDASSFAFGLIGVMANLRSKWLKAPYGDQAIFIKREVFRKIGGYREIPIMEDTRLVTDMKQEGRIVIIDDYAITSSRKWLKEGATYTTIRNWIIMLAYKMGAKPENLVKWYYR
ncbi:hypothetical protein MNBD_NITROSPINAE02-1641 [hydrothermal vent metagenome]|uniref:Glycosyltransferase 2-like domain-containing protein n=1 Tax=hydrothermal vent metagenome TaxID=652676 RepID=A0A3B1BU65_9ZZZZ